MVLSEILTQEAAHSHRECLKIREALHVIGLRRLRTVVNANVARVTDGDNSKIRDQIFISGQFAWVLLRQIRRIESLNDKDVGIFRRR